MDFSSAISLLVQVHDNEVQRLQASNAELKSKISAMTQNRMDFAHAESCNARESHEEIEHTFGNLHHEEQPSMSVMPTTFHGMEESLYAAAIVTRPTSSQVLPHPKVEPIESSQVDHKEEACGLRHDEGRKRMCSKTFSDSEHVSECEKLPINSQGLPHPKSESVDSSCSDHEEHLRMSSTTLSDSDHVSASDLQDATPQPRHSRLSQGMMEVWPVWTKESSQMLLKSTSKGPLSFGSTFSNASQIVRAGDEMRVGGLIQMLAMRPSSKHRIIWDILSIAVLAYDVLLIPLAPFDFPETYFMWCMNVITTVFWSVDVFFSFVTGYNDMGVLEMRLKNVARRYLRSWFSIDVAILIVDYFLLISSAGVNSVDFLSFVRMGKTLRVVRVLRMFRLLRLFKAMNTFFGLSDGIFSEAALTFFRVIKLIIAIVLINHFLACGWYAVGLHTAQANVNTWVRRLEAVDDNETSFAWFYTSALHWSITQFTPASMEIVPCNFIERCYALCVILFALVAFSSFVSSITTSMTHFRAINMEYSQQKDLIRRYITENRVSVDLGNRIQAFLRQSRRAENQRHRISEEDIPCISSLPETLRMELHGEIFVPVLTTHFFFAEFQHYDEAGLLSICHKSITGLSLKRGHALFSTGEECVRMFFVQSGRLDYLYALDSVPTVHLETGDYLSEMSLWLKWEHQGRLLAGVSSAVAGLDSRQFRAVACRTESFDSCKLYAQNYARKLSEIRCREETDQQNTGDIFDVQQDLARQAFESKQSERNRSKFAWFSSWNKSTSTIGSRESTRFSIKSGSYRASRRSNRSSNTSTRKSITSEG